MSNSIQMVSQRQEEHRVAAQQKAGVLPWVTVALLLAAVFLVGNSKIVAGSQAPIWDAWAFYAPEFTLVADHGRMGRLVLWNPWIAGGAPDLAEPQVGAASPITVLMGAVFGGTGVGFRAYWLLIWFLGPLGLLLLGRHLGSPPWATFVVALGFAFGSFYTGHAEHTSLVYSFSFLPLLVWRLDVALLSRRVRPAVETGAIWGLSALGGYPALTILNAGFLCLWAIGRLVVGPADESGLKNSTVAARFRTLVVSLILVFGAGVLVLSPTYFAFFTEGPGYTDRAGPLSRAYSVSSNELDPGTLTTFASPYLHLLKYPGLNPTLWPKTDISAMGIYMGALPFILAFLAILQRPQSAWRWWLAGTALFALACALGDHLPIRGWLYDYCPPTRYFRHPAVFRGYSLFAAAILALLSGSDIGRASESSRLWRKLLCTSVVTGSAALFAYYYVISHVSHLADGLRRADRHVALVWGGAILISLLFVILPRIRTLLPAMLCALAMMDASLTIRISQPLVSDAGFFLPMWNRIDANHERDLTLGSLQRDLRPPDWLTSARNNNNISLKVPTLYNDSSMANRFHTDFAQHPVVANAALGSDRIWFAKEIAIVSPFDQSYNAFVQRSDSLGSPVLVVHPLKEMRKMYQRDLATLSQGAQKDVISHLPPAHKLPVKLQRYSPNHLDFTVVCPDDGWLLVTDRWGNGWRAKVNGQPQEVLGGDFIFRAIRVRAGENKVEFSYRPRTYLVLVALSWGALALILVILPISRLWAGRELRTDSQRTALLGEPL